jgi:hypothetical protein
MMRSPFERVVLHMMPPSPFATLSSIEVSKILPHMPSPQHKQQSPVLTVSPRLP